MHSGLLLLLLLRLCVDEIVCGDGHRHVRRGSCHAHRQVLSSGRDNCKPGCRYGTNPYWSWTKVDAIITKSCTNVTTLSSKGLVFLRPKLLPFPSYVKSEQNAVRKQRGWVIRLVRGGGGATLQCVNNKEGEKLSLFWCTQSNPTICTDPLIETMYSNCIISVSLF